MRSNETLLELRALRQRSLLLGRAIASGKLCPWSVREAKWQILRMKRLMFSLHGRGYLAKEAV